MAVSGITINGDGTATWLITAEDSATLPKGRIPVSIKAWRPFIPRINDLYAYWSLDEAAGNTRVKSLGTATSADLLEENGVVATAAGKFGTAVQSDPADNHWLRSGVLDPTLSLVGGFTVALRVYLDAYAGPEASNIWALGKTGSGGRAVLFDRYANNLYVGIQGSSGGGAPARSVQFTDVSLSAWHLLLGRYDPTTRIW